VVFCLCMLFVLCTEVYYWGCAKVSGRGTLYMKWGQGNLRFATMRLRGEKKGKREKERKYKILVNIQKKRKYDKM